MVAAAVLTEASTMTTQATTPTPEPPATRRLTRSSDDRVIAGVCGGLGRYFGIDPVVCRLIIVVLAFFGGAGLIAYGAAWLIVPSDNAPAGSSGARALLKRAGLALGLLIVSGALAIGGALAAAPGGATVGAIIVIAAGAALIVGGFLAGLRGLIAPPP